MSGCAAIRSILQRFSSDSIKIDLFDMGRGVGGRTATRKTREDKRINVSHGCPSFVATDAHFISFCDDLVRKGVLLRVNDRDKHYRGVSGSVAFAEGLLAELSPNADYTPRMQTMVKQMNFDTMKRTWALHDKDGQSLGEYDWVIVSGNTIAHPRWTKVFGGVPPLMEAATQLEQAGHKCERLNHAIEKIGKMEADPVFVGMTVFQFGDENLFLGDQGDETSQQRIIHLNERANEKVSKAVLTTDFVQKTLTLVLHSSHNYARSNIHVYGSSSTAARMCGTPTDAGREQEILEDLYHTAYVDPIAQKDPQLSVILDAALKKSKPMIWGPILHRWGSAFPTGDSLSNEEAYIPEAQIIFAGDYVGRNNVADRRPHTQTTDEEQSEEALNFVEAAVLSGIRVADLISSL